MSTRLVYHAARGVRAVRRRMLLMGMLLLASCALPGGAPPTATFPPDFAGLTVYVGSFDDAVYALRASDGGLRWRYKTGDSLASSPVLVDGVLYVGSNDGALYALDARNGTVKWARRTASRVHTPSVAGGVAYFVSEDGLHAVRTSDGADLWLAPEAVDPAGRNFDPVVAEGMVFARSAIPGSLVVHGASDGQVKQLYQVEDGGQISGPPAIAGGVIYVASYIGPAVGGHLTALRASDAQVLWRDRIVGFVDGDRPTVSGGVVYVNSSSENLVYAIDAPSGQILWRHALAGPTTPVAVNGVVYVGAGDNGMHALRTSDGKELWHFQTGAAIFGAAAVANGAVFVGSADGYVYALHVDNGALGWRFRTGDQVDSTPAVGP